jgi:5-methylcytosine-specific restriction protein A
VPQKITDEQVKNAYFLGKFVHSDSISLSEAAEQLSEKYAMNSGSARGYINTFQRMISGQEYRRTINAYATDYYLSQILSDFGASALNIAIDSVRKHLEYYEGVGKSSQPKIHAIVDNHLNNLEKAITLNEHSQDFEELVASALNETQGSRLTRLKVAKKKPKEITVVSKSYRRNPDVVAEVLFRAKGICERCHIDAPFNKAKDGSPYLEVHHKIQLAKGGEDSIENAVALCPNCHRELHFG